MVLLPNDEAQVIACGLSSNGWEIYNQQITTIVQQTLLYEHVTIQVVNAIIGIPGTITSTMQDFGLTKVQGLMTSLGVGNLGNSPGITVFAAEDAAFGRDSSQIALASPLIMFENHVSGRSTSLFVRQLTRAVGDYWHDHFVHNAAGVAVHVGLGDELHLCAGPERLVMERHTERRHRQHSQDRLPHQQRSDAYS